MKAPVIYKIRNVVNGKFYVGSTMDTRERFRTHRNKLRRSTHHCAHLQSAWNKYGEDCFVFEIVENIASSALLQAAEDVWLTAHVGKDYCYNTGTRSGAPWRDGLKEAHPCFGVPKPENVRSAIATSLRATYAAYPLSHPRTGTTHSPETRAKISANRVGKMAGEDHYRFGQTVSAEVREKIAAAQRGVKKAPRVYTPEGLARAQENMRKHAKEQVPVDFASVYAKFPPEVQARYDFRSAQYTGALARIEGCMCPVHGIFSQYAAQFRKGRGCPECGAVQRAESKSLQMKEEWAVKKAGLPTVPVV
jgi:group I intron endonuclease